MGIIGLASAAQLSAHGIDPATAAQVVEMCSNNVSVTISKLSIYLEPKISNIECLLFGVSCSSPVWNWSRLKTKSDFFLTRFKRRWLNQTTTKHGT